MPKVLSNSEYDKLNQSADNYKDVVSVILGLNSELKQEDITADVVKQMITQGAEDSSADVLNLKQSLKNVQSELKISQDRVTELEKQNANLLGTPPEDPAEVTSDKELTAKASTIADFADKNAGDTVTILNECKKEGLI